MAHIAGLVLGLKSIGCRLFTSMSWCISFILILYVASGEKSFVTKVVLVMFFKFRVVVIDGLR